MADMNMEDEKSKIGQMLVEANLITEEQLKKALDFQKSLGGKLGHIIVKLGFIEDDVLTEFMAKQQGLEIADLEKLVLPENLVKRIPKDIIITHQVIPIAFKDGVLTLATSDPTDYEAVEATQLATDYKVEFALATRSSIQKAINELFFSGKEEEEEKPVEEATRKEELMRELEAAPSGREEEISATAGLSPMQLRRALIPLLIEKGIITEEELVKKAKELGG
jgi:type IV pilus assembly protein PilB